MKRRLLATLVGLIALTLPSHTDAQDTGDPWRFTVLPYLWFPTIAGTVRYDLPSSEGSTVDVKLEPGDYLSDLQFAALLAGEVRRGPWSVGTDILYMDLDAHGSRVKSIQFDAGQAPVDASLNANTHSGIKELVWTLVGGHSLAKPPWGTADAIAGFRYTHVSSNTDWNLTTTVPGPGGSQTFPRSGHASQSDDSWDFVVGLRGRAIYGATRWFSPYYADIGAGSSELTWQILLGLGYAFTPGFDVSVGYRYLAFQMPESKMLQEMNMSGAALGAAFHF